MKKLFTVLLVSAALFACSEDSVTNDENQRDLLPQVEADLSKMTPNPSFDSNFKGTYSGVVVADDTNFHGRLYLNIENADNRADANIITIEGKRLSFKGEKISDSAYSFVGDRGSFEVDLTDISMVNINDLTIDGSSGNARVRKELAGTKNALVLGTFDDILSVDFSLPQSFTGTWDFIIDAGTAPFISEVVFTTAGGNMVSDFAIDMEAGDGGCVTGGVLPPTFVEDVDAGLWELVSVGQIIPLAGGRTLGYDYTFSKGLLDFNDIPDYSTGGGFMPLMNGLIFGGGLTGCNTFAYHGFYLLDDGVAFIAGGGITFDTSIVPPPPPPTFGPVDGIQATPAPDFSLVLGDL